MQEFLLKIQEAAYAIEARHLLWGPGCGAVVLGLFLWLGGVRYSMFVIGILGAMAGSAVGLLISSWFGLSVPLCVVIAAAVLAIVAMMVEKMVIALLAMVICALTFGSAYLGFQINDLNWTEIENQRTAATTDLLMDSAKPSEPVYAEDYTAPPGEPDPLASEYSAPPENNGPRPVSEQIKEAFARAGSNNKVMLTLWIVLGAAVGLALAYVLKKIVMALSCSVVGAAGIIAGFTAALLAKQTAAISYILDHSQLTLSVFGGMAVFGTFFQLILAPKPKETTSKEEDD